MIAAWRVNEVIGSSGNPCFVNLLVRHLLGAIFAIRGSWHRY